MSVAEQLDFFRLEGLEVTTLDYASDMLALQALKQGVADVAAVGFEHALPTAAVPQGLRSLVLQTRVPQMALAVSSKAAPTHRSVALPQAVLDNTRKNALSATTLAGGMAVDKVLPGIPFPIPKSGAEAMWNFLLRYQGVNIATKYDSWNVDAAGTAALSTTGQAFINYAIYEDMAKPISAKDTYYQMKLHYTGPARRAGEAIMLRDAANPLEQPRKAWQYLPGQRRVKLAPNLAYDTPNPDRKSVV